MVPPGNAQRPEAATQPDGNPQGAPGVQLSTDDYAHLKQRNLLVPVLGADPSTLVDTFNEGRAGGKKHEATDILAPRGTEVLAVDDGTLVKLFYSVRGGNTIYEFDPSGTYCYYYAHLDGYASGLTEGQALRRGQVIGYVGTSGDAPANTPHLHFAIFKLGPEKQWWKGEPINPFPLLTGKAEQ